MDRSHGKESMMAKRRNGGKGIGAKSRKRAAEGSNPRARSSANASAPDVTINVTLADDVARGAAMRRAVAVGATARKHFGRRAHRLLSVQHLEPRGTEAAAAAGKKREDEPPAYKSTYYDYTLNQAVEIIAGPTRTRVSESARQPLPSREEFDAAVAALRKHPEIGPALREGALTSYRSMPPVLGVLQPDGSTRRLLTVGLRPADGTGRHEIVG